MDGGVVILLDPLGELFIELLDRGEIEIANEELIANSTKETLDLPLGRRIADCRVTQQTTHPSANKRDFLAAVDRTVVDQQLLRQSTLVECTAQCTNHRVGVFFKEEFAVTQDTTGIIDKGDQLRQLASDL